MYEPGPVRNCSCAARKTGSVLGRRRTFRSLRHDFNSNLASVGVPGGVRLELTGRSLQ